TSRLTPSISPHWEPILARHHPLVDGGEARIGVAWAPRKGVTPGPGDGTGVGGHRRNAHILPGEGRVIEVLEGL
ncbi:MAG: hypothetical protein MUO38_13045, partial [Anaerolineales bacterium]|nr:hypothetical protein [Anaerolineales bacterium]